ncbi:hypothetical protein AURDEDRAFT_114183, partial [Auricularia subglabra TFB-10046 SS5]
MLVLIATFLYPSASHPVYPPRPSVRPGPFSNLAALKSNRLPELTNVATVARRARPTLVAASPSCKALKADIACAPFLSEVQDAAAAARLARSRPGPGKAVPVPSQGTTAKPQRASSAYACQTVPSRAGRIVEVPRRELEELEVIVFPAPERPSSTLLRMETMLEDLRANGL